MLPLAKTGQELDPAIKPLWEPISNEWSKLIRETARERYRYGLYLGESQRRFFEGAHMNESQWLSSTDPSAMWRHLEPTCTDDDPRCRAFVEECRRRWPGHTNATIAGNYNWKQIAGVWISQGWGEPTETADILREVFGNPFHQSGVRCAVSTRLGVGRSG